LGRGAGGVCVPSANVGNEILGNTFHRMQR